LDASTEELFRKFLRERDAASHEQVVRAYRPLVASVCKRFLRRAEDVDDAVQETFLKLAQHAHTIRGSPTSWLLATAYATAVDLIRQALRERRRREQLMHLGPAPRAARQLLHHAIQSRLHDALLVLDETDRELIVARFFRREPLRAVAGRMLISVPTASRRTNAAISQLATVLREMGAGEIDDLALSEHFGALMPVAALPHGPSGPGEAPDDSLRFATDWRTPMLSSALAPSMTSMRDETIPTLPGWPRPLRIGVFVSYTSWSTVGWRGIRQTMETQVQSTPLLVHPALQAVGVIEPGTDRRGLIETTLRDYELTAGLIDATDVESLKTLDVILFGQNFALRDDVARAFHEAVSAGVGLLNEHWTGMTDDCCDQQWALGLAVPPVHRYHTLPRCNLPLPATVIEEHPLLPGLTRGRAIQVSGCGVVHRVAEGARVIVHKDLLFAPDQHGIPRLGPARMPVYIVGTLGRGRVVVSNLLRQSDLTRYLSMSPTQYFLDLMSWLAEPRRDVR
jgi:RNA polymerase sigma factor (sigma-70 family)